MCFSINLPTKVHLTLQAEDCKTRSGLAPHGLVSVCIPVDAKPKPYMNYSLDSLEGGYIGNYTGLVKGNRSLDYSHVIPEPWVAPQNPQPYTLGGV